MKEKNVLIIMDDEHNPKMLGCNNHPLVKTPNLDRLAARGTRFTSAYTNSPICVPARAALATGRYVHETGCWDNAIAYDGILPSWGHHLQKNGNRVVSIGKLHYTDEKAPTGFDDQIIPMHIQDGVGDLHGSIRDELPVRYQSRDLAQRIGPGESTYVEYDRKITDSTCAWLRTEASKHRDKPWALFCSFISPHSPLMAPQNYYDMYPVDRIQMPKKRPAGFQHPWWDALNRCYIFDESFESDHHRKIAIASYFGLCTFIDDCVGRVLSALDVAGLSNDTRVLFLSDHGDNMGARGLWGKSTMYEESAGVPMMMAGPDIPSGKVVRTPVSLVDIFPTVLDWMGLNPSNPDNTLRGDSLSEIANAPYDANRTVFSEYHAAGATSGAFMLRKGRYKYIHYVGFAPELYDLELDPEELHDLSVSAEHRGVIVDFEKQLRTICNPERIDKLAKKAQAALINKHGGREAIIKQGGISYTTAPGEKAVYI